MGLAIVRKIAEYYGGSATIDPAWPEGAMFVVTLADPPEISRRQEAGRFPFDRLVTFYDFDEIDTAIHDAHEGGTIKAVLRVSDV